MPVEEPIFTRSKFTLVTVHKNYITIVIVCVYDRVKQRKLLESAVLYAAHYRGVGLEVRIRWNKKPQPRVNPIRMFILSELQDIVRIEPHKFSQDMEEQIRSELNKKFANKVSSKL